MTNINMCFRRWLIPKQIMNHEPIETHWETLGSYGGFIPYDGSPTSSTSFSDGLYYKNYKSCARNIIQNFFWNIIKVLIINRNHTHIYIYIWRFPEMGVPQIIHFNGIFPYTPFISGFPHLWNTTVSLRHRLA